MPRKPKGSSARFVHGGGPKIRPKGVVDGQQVNIPLLPLVGPEVRRRPKDGYRFKNTRCPLFFQGKKG
jgi:hypothetical protein